MAAALVLVQLERLVKLERRTRISWRSARPTAALAATPAGLTASAHVHDIGGAGPGPAIDVAGPRLAAVTGGAPAPGGDVHPHRAADDAVADAEGEHVPLVEPTLREQDYCEQECTGFSAAPKPNSRTTGFW